MTDTNIVKVVVPSFGLKGAFERVDLNRKEFETLQEDYLAEQLALLETISTRDIVDKIHIETARMLLDKMIPPFQYWLENEFACNKLNSGNPKPVDPHTKKVLEQAAKQREARNAVGDQNLTEEELRTKYPKLRLSNNDADLIAASINCPI